MWEGVTGRRGVEGASWDVEERGVPYSGGHGVEDAALGEETPQNVSERTALLGSR